MVSSGILETSHQLPSHSVSPSYHPRTMVGTDLMYPERDVLPSHSHSQLLGVFHAQARHLITREAEKEACGETGGRAGSLNPTLSL